METRRKHSSIITEEYISRFKKLWEVGENAVRNSACGPIYDHEARGITSRGRCLRDEMRR